MTERPPGLDALLDYVTEHIDRPRPQGNHIGRSWNNTHLEDGCPCPKAPCGLVIQDQTDPTCSEHPWVACKSIRQSHRAEDCPSLRDEP